MINELYIENFKSLKKFSLNNLKKINLIGGQNNIGKTNILEAYFLMHDRFSPISILKQYNRRGINNFDLSQNLWAPIFHKYDLSKTIKIKSKKNTGYTEELIIKLHNQSVQRSLNFKETIQSLKSQEQGDITSQPNSEIKMSFKADGKQTQDFTLRAEGDQINLESNVNNLNQRNVTSGSFLSSRMQTNPSEESVKYGKLDIIGKSDMIIEFLKVIEPRLQNISAISMGGETLLHADIGIGRKIPINYMGDGFVRLLSIILSIASSENGFVVIDEFENGLHYSIMPKIWKSITEAANEYNCQLFITTHSYECLQAAYAGLKTSTFNSEFSYSRIFKNDEGFLSSKTIDYTTLGIALESNLEVR